MFTTWTNQLGNLSGPVHGPSKIYTDSSGKTYTYEGAVPGAVDGTASQEEQNLAACRAYVVKYTATYGYAPDVWCNAAPQAPVIPTPVVDAGPRCTTGYYPSGGACLPVPVLPAPVTPTPVVSTMPPPQPPLSPGPVHTWRPKKMPRPVVRRPYRPRQQVPVATVAAPSSEICPAAGYTRRNIAGAGEYQVVRCQPGQPVVIDQGLARTVRTEALARHGMIGGLSGLDDISIGNIDIPMWSIVAVAGLAALFFFKRR